MKLEKQGYLATLKKNEQMCSRGSLCGHGILSQGTGMEEAEVKDVPTLERQALSL